MTKAFEKIAARLADAIAYAEGDTTKGCVMAGPDVKAIHAEIKRTQPNSVMLNSFQHPSSRQSRGR